MEANGLTISVTTPVTAIFVKPAFRAEPSFPTILLITVIVWIHVIHVDTIFIRYALLAVASQTEVRHIGGGLDAEFVAIAGLTLPMLAVLVLMVIAVIIVGAFSFTSVVGEALLSWAVDIIKALYTKASLTKVK